MKMKKLSETHKRFKELGLFNEYTSILSVDNWEIPVKNIVINRELGEGAFGKLLF